MGIIPQRLRASPAFQRVLRVLQFLSAIISLGLFSSRLYKIIRLLRHASASNGAVEGILAAAALYTLLAMLLRFVIKGSGSSILRWLLVLLDILFVIAFIVVAVLTSPKRGGSSGPCHSQFNQRITPKGYNCNLPIGVFVLAILSTLVDLLFPRVLYNQLTKSVLAFYTP